MAINYDADLKNNVGVQLIINIALECARPLSQNSRRMCGALLVPYPIKTTWEKMHLRTVASESRWSRLSPTLCSTRGSSAASVVVITGSAAHGTRSQSRGNRAWSKEPGTEGLGRWAGAEGLGLVEVQGQKGLIEEEGQKDVAGRSRRY